MRTLICASKICASRFTKCAASQPLIIRTLSSTSPLYVRNPKQPQKFDDEEEFRVLELVPKKADKAAERRPPAYRMNVPPPRADRMSTDQDWSSVWPAARMFHPAVVPLPVHMGYIEKPELYSPPGKFANAELMKIPNFLHLTPPAIKKHCEALKKFCTKWPEELKTDEDCHEAFPMEYIFSDYVHAAPTIRDARARIVTVRFNINDLQLDYHAKDKLRRLLNGNETRRLDEKSGLITINADRCPLKRQNYDYLNYLITALYFEAWKREPWEEEITPADWERYYWEKSSSRQNIINYAKQVAPELVKDENKFVEKAVVKKYATAVTALYDNGETDENVDAYKEAVVNMLFGDALQSKKKAESKS